MSIWVKPDLDLADLCLWLADLKTGPVVLRLPSATISTILQSELEVKLVICLQFTDSDKVVIVVELFSGREVFVLTATLEWQVRISESVREFLSLLWDNILSTSIDKWCIFCLLKTLVLRLDSQILV